jgi:peptidoglycan-N-acetylglucosamine deacetylase
MMLPLAMTAAGVAGAAFAAAYQSAWPTACRYGRTFTGLPSGTKLLALTYDDGPNDPYTLDLLEVLFRHQAHATFFMIGQHVRQRPDIAAEVAKAGHAIGNHTFTHPLLTFKSQADIRKQLSDCRDAIFEAIGNHSTLFRPPFGGRRPAVLRIARQLGLEPIMWRACGFDWNAPPAAVIETKVSNKIRGGDVILLHDGGHRKIGADRSQTVRATDNLLNRYQDQGYQFVTVPEMIETLVRSLQRPAVAVASPHFEDGAHKM